MRAPARSASCSPIGHTLRDQSHVVPEGRQLLAVVSRDRSADDDTRVALQSREGDVEELRAHVVEHDVDEAKGAELLREIFGSVVYRQVDPELVAQPAALLVVSGRSACAGSL